VTVTAFATLVVIADEPLAGAAVEKAVLKRMRTTGDRLGLSCS
jgi:hypothetical protein